MLRGKIEELGSAEREQLLVRGDDVLACRECSAQPTFDRIESADQLYNCIDVRRGEDVFGAIRPDCVCRHKPGAFMLTLALHTTVEDARDPDLVVRSSGEHLSERTADRTKPKQT